MRKLLDGEILDIIPTDQGFVYCARETLANGSQAGAFYSYNQATDTFSQATMLLYLQSKFGSFCRKIADCLGDFITCEVVRMENGCVAAIYPDGELKIFDAEGDIRYENKLLYQTMPARAPVSDGKDLWFTVPDINAIINYSTVYNRVELRIGGANSKAFCHPIHLFKDDKKLYVCNEYSYKIRTIRLDNYAVEDYKNFNEAVTKFFRVYDVEYAILQSGVYIVN